MTTVKYVISLLGGVLTLPQFWATIVGTFVGAFLAFQFGIRRDTLLRRRDEKIAGNVAMTLLARQYTDYILLKREILKWREVILKQLPDAPLWFQMMPVAYPISESREFDVKALGFLLDQKGGAKVLQQILDVELMYTNFVHLMGTHRKHAEEMQDKLAESGLDPHANTAIRVVEEKLGYSATTRLNSLVGGILEHIEKDEQKYLAAARCLHDLLAMTFGKKGVLRVEPDTGPI